MYHWTRGKIAPPPRLFFALVVILLALSLAACSEQLANTGGANTGSANTGSANTANPPAAASQAVEEPSTDVTPPAALPPAAEPTRPVPAETQAESAPPTTAPASEAEAPTAELEAPEETAPAEIACASPAEPTPPMTEGPYYKTGSPERTSLLEPGIPGTPLLLTGYVLTTDCKPVPGAWIDFWQTDGEGVYDNVGYRLRGHQLTDESGRYVLETVAPGIYPGRTAHIHVKVQAPNGPVLTSQLFLPGEPGNETDRIFSPQLVMQVEEGPDGLLGSFNFILDNP